MSYDAEAFDAFEAAGWAEKDAGAYDMLLGRVTQRFAEPLLDAVDAGPGMRLLDLATGPGYVAGRAVARGAEAVGLDRSEAMLEFARQHVPGVEFVRGDVTDVPFDDGSFDAVTGAFLLLHLGEPERAGEEAARVLVPGGAVAFTVWDVPSRGRWLGVLVDAIDDVGVSPSAAVPAGPPFFRFADEAELTELLTGAGLTDPVMQTVETRAGGRKCGRALERTHCRGRAHARGRARSERRRAACDPSSLRRIARRPRRRRRLRGVGVGQARLGAKAVIDRERLVADALAAVSIPSFTGSEEAMAALVRGAVRGARARRPVAAGRGRARERARDPRRHRRRADADVQRAHGHVVLRPRAVAGRDPRLPAGGLRARRADLRARDLEHEGRARRLPRGGAGARRYAADAAT